MTSQPKGKLGAMGDAEEMKARRRTFHRHALLSLLISFD
jgi:hypothetical protein